MPSYDFRNAGIAEKRFAYGLYANTDRARSTAEKSGYKLAATSLHNFASYDGGGGGGGMQIVYVSSQPDVSDMPSSRPHGDMATSLHRVMTVAVTVTAVAAAADAAATFLRLILWMRQWRVR